MSTIMVATGCSGEPIRFNLTDGVEGDMAAFSDFHDDVLNSSSANDSANDDDIDDCDDIDEFIEMFCETPPSEFAALAA